ncbi:glycosyltransferase family 2 protein [Vibrio alfacsensis]|uniref:glycosyltransferase family 2 protein n=1 Tax=Vibrio alfacsensis TaxID=1074311 RepID=UPI004068EFA5
MIDFLNLFFGFVFFIIVLIPSIFLSLELIAGSILKTNQTNKKLDVSIDDAFIIIPAHNEQTILENTLINLKKEIGNLNNVVVIADNCTDMTADIAIQHGACVVERHSDSHKGKGYALDAGINYLRPLSPKVVVVFDADCEFVSGSFINLVQSCKHNNAVIQSEYLMKTSPSGFIKYNVAEFAWLVKNKVRPYALSMFGINCQLQGSGMAFPWRVFERVSFASGSIVEDLEFGLKLNSLSERVIYDSSSIVISYFPESEIGSKTQRTRWEHGHLSSISLMPKAILANLLKGNIRGIFTILDAMIPPTVFFVTFVFFCFISSLFLLIIDIRHPFYFSSISIFSVFFGLFVCWFKFGRNILSFKDTSAILIYLTSKINIYKAFIRAKESKWTRTNRENSNGK